MSSLLDVGDMYLESKVKVHSYEVASSTLKLFFSSLRLLRYSLNDDYGNTYWDFFRNVASRYRYEHLKCPIRLSDLGSLPDNVLLELEEKYAEVREIYPSSYETFLKVFQALQTCLSENENPLLDVITEMFPNLGMKVEDGHISILTENSKVELIKDSLKTAYPEVRNWEQHIYVPRQLKKTFLSSELLAFGSPRSLNFSGNEWLLSAPRAYAYHFLTFDFENNRLDLPVAFPMVNKPKLIDTSIQRYASSVGISHNSSEDNSEDNVKFENSEFDLSRDQVESANVTDAVLDQSEIVEAQMLFLEGERRVWVDVSPSSSYMIVDLDDDRKVVTVPGADIEVGIFYLYREGDTDFIPDVANGIMGIRSLTLRGAQSKWKSGLKSRINAYGSDIVADRLAENGSTIANVSNLRNWISPRNICTQNEQDFRAIAKYLGLEDESGLLWQQMNEIRTAHRKAGRLVKKALINLITDSDNLEQLLDDGWEEFNLGIEKSNSLVAREVLQISVETHLMSESMIGLFETFGQVS